MTINVIHFYRRLDTRSILVTSERLEKNPFPFDLERVGCMKTLLSITQIRSLVRQGVSHVDIYNEHRYVEQEPVDVPVTLPEPPCEEISPEVTHVYVYSSPGAQNGVKVTTEHRPNQTILLDLAVSGKDKVQEVLKALRERVRNGDRLEDIRSQIAVGQGNVIQVL